jgi:RPA family protein
VTGKVGRWESGPTILAATVTAQGELQAVAPPTIDGALDATLEWQLIEVCGRIERYTAAGSRWRLDVNVSGNVVAVLGEPDAGIGVASSDVGRLVLVVGIVRRSTSDSAVFQLVPRSVLDFHMGPAPATSDTGSSDTGSSDTGSYGSPSPGASITDSPLPSISLTTGTVEIGSLAAHIGETVSVAGLVTDTTTTTATIDDGTGSVVVVGAAAAEALSMLEPGDAIEVTGLVRQDDSGLTIEADPDSVVALPGARDADSAATPASATATAATRLRVETAASSSAPATSNVAGSSVRMATSQTGLPDWATLVTVLGLALAAVAGVLAAVAHSGRFRRRAIPAGRELREAVSDGLLRRVRGLGKGR